MPITWFTILFTAWACLGGSLFAAWQAGASKADIT
ncbi:MAG: hypothetical protein RIS79_1859, partial [Verrucomicrobiota bacterium]